MKRIVLILLMVPCLREASAQVLVGTKGSVVLEGVAPNETIVAKSSTLQVKLEVESNEFNFRQPLNMFSFSQGSLQKKDAEEKYWETEKYPYASFKGKILNEINLRLDGEYTVTASGVFSMHGVQQDVKIPATLKIKDGIMSIKSNFSIFLSDYRIEIPRLVALKVSEEFDVMIEIELK